MTFIKDLYSGQTRLRILSHSHTPLIPHPSPLTLTPHPIYIVQSPCVQWLSHLCILFQAHQVMTLHPRTRQYTAIAREKKELRNHDLVNFSHLHINQGSPLLPILLALSWSLHRHPSATQGYLGTIHPT